MLEVVLDNQGNGVHRAVFLNGSRLGGFLAPTKLKLKLKIGRELEVGRDKIIRLRFAAEARPDPGLTVVRLSNEDELYGQILQEKIQLVTRYNPIPLLPENIRAIRKTGQQVVVEMWNGSVHKGRLGQEELAFEIKPGPKVTVHTQHVLSVVRPRPLPPEATRKIVDELVALLGAESYKERQEATEKLIKMQGIGSLLIKHLKHTDPEVRQRIEEILEKMGGVKVPPAVVPAMKFQRALFIQN
jgi:hypothetical protein